MEADLLDTIGEFASLASQAKCRIEQPILG
jgi:hypothetical protein